MAAVYNPAGSTAADKFYVYVNGTEKETARYETSCTLADTKTSLLIGHDSDSAPSGGRSVALSQLAFFFRSLNQTEAQHIYSNPSSGKTLIDIQISFFSYLFNHKLHSSIPLLVALIQSIIVMVIVAMVM